MQKRRVSNSSQESVDKRPLSLSDVTRTVVQQKLLHFVCCAKDERVLEKSKLFLVHHSFAVELVVINHVDTSVEFLVTKLLPLDDWLQNVEWMNLQ